MPAGADQPDPPRRRHTVLRTEDKPGLFHVGHNDDALGPFHQILGDSFIVRMHHIHENVRRSIEPVRGAAFFVCCDGQRGENRGRSHT
jgi:hypothetical protein